ncbi:UDP-N-acetylmuramoyl-tripeptide--D-alanyl-D-alanine ligase [Candidatus Wolfebacteria bacterium]|nr:UDP-N-acetylmuramoyl-tripeptide--D-alanyl-D-alanine ligase [Candidatus Wolfebacteria bacterium]
MPSFYLFLFFFWLAAVLKSVLFWVYLWQIKEYRLDRFGAEYGDSQKLIRFWIFSGGRKFWRPKWTLKAILIFWTSLGITTLFVSLPVVSREVLVAIYLALIYLFLPLLVSLVVLFWNIPFFFLKRGIAAQARRKIKKLKKLLVIGIAGSYGKSSTKEFLAQILARKFKVLKTPENVNSEIGVAQFVLDNLVSDTEILIAEMGAYRKGEIKRICRMVKPKIGILTGINEQHLALFGSLENIKKAKFELIESLPKDGLAVFNGEDPRVLDLAKSWPGKGLIYRHNVVAPRRNFPRHYEINLNAAIDVAKYLGMTEKEIEAAIKDIKPDGKMIKTFTGKNGVLVIDDTYSVNPDGVLAALDYLAEQPRKTKIVVMPCIIELGRAAHDVHARIGKKIAEVCDLAIITTPDYFEDIKSGTGGKAILENNPKKIAGLLGAKLSSETVILLEGRIQKEIIDFFS